MPAVVNYAPEPNSVEIREVPIPEIGDEDVLLAVQAVGVCGTDIHLAYGQRSGKINYPVILGHEFGGVIAQVGKNVRGFKEGDRVVSETAAVIDEKNAIPNAIESLCRWLEDPVRFPASWRGAIQQTLRAARASD